LTLKGESLFECQILFFKRKYSLKLEAGILSRTKSNNSLTNALVMHEEEHILNIFVK
jgi:hypothetical protein